MRNSDRTSQKRGRSSLVDAADEQPANLRQQQGAETRRRLLESATEVFLEALPTTASLNEIAARAGVRRQTLLYHFGNRNGLMSAVLTHHLDTYRAQIHELHGGLEVLLQEYLRTHRQPLVRMIRHLAFMPGSPAARRWYQIVATELERCLVDAGLPASTARRRGPVLTYALLRLAEHVADDRASQDDIDQFVLDACDLVLTPARTRAARAS